MPPCPFCHMVDLTTGPAVETMSPEPSYLPHEGKYLPLWEKAPAERKDSRPANLITLSRTSHCPLCLYSISGLPPNGSVTVLPLALEGKTHACDILIILLMDSIIHKQICLIPKSPFTELQTTKHVSRPTGETISKINKADRRMTWTYSPALSLAYMQCCGQVWTAAQNKPLWLMH